MWRSFFLAAGAYSCLLGAQCLTIDRAVLTNKEPAPSRWAGMNWTGDSLTRGKELTPPDWAPWSFISLGAVTLLYSFTLPKRASGA